MAYITSGTASCNVQTPDVSIKYYVNINRFCPKMSELSFVQTVLFVIWLICFQSHAEAGSITTVIHDAESTSNTVGPLPEERLDVTEGEAKTDYNNNNNNNVALGDVTGKPDGERWTLNAITWIGSLLSIAGLILCIITFVLIKKLREKQPTKIHINLCLCLIGFYISFLTGDVASPPEISCKNAALAIKYFALSTVGWMTVEAVNMYFLFVKYERMSIRHFIPASCLLVYVYPLIPVLVEVCVTTGEEYNCCFLPPAGSGHFYVFLCVIMTMVMFNFVAFLLVIRNVVCRKMVTTDVEQTKRKELIARIQQFGLFWVLLGPSWIFGFLSIVPSDRNYTSFSGTLFCICTSLQGFVLFLFICVRNPEVRRLFERNQSRKTDVLGMKGEDQD